jgi:hypothetical protein
MVVLIEAPGRVRRQAVFGWWRRWRKAVARRKKQGKRRERFSDWDNVSRYGDPFDGA